MDFDKVGADGLGELEVVVTCPGDRHGSVFGVAVGEADPAFFGDIEFAAQFPVVGFLKVGVGVFGWDGDGANFVLGDLF